MEKVICEQIYSEEVDKCNLNIFEKKSKVSIITPSYNSSKYISETIESVISQTHKDWEMIIVDDCSSDNTRELVEKFSKKDSRIKLIKLDKNSGAAIARNIALKNSTGHYIAYLDSDDIWYPNKLECQINFMKKINMDFHVHHMKL